MKTKMTARTAALVLSLFTAFIFLSAGPPAAGAGGTDASRPIIGVKVYENRGGFERLFAEWKELGINTAFVGEALLADPIFRAGARANGITLYVIFPVFQNPEELQERPDLAAVTDRGEPAREEWVQFVCPTRNDYKERRIEHLRRIVREHDPDVVSLDFIRYFVFWEMVQPGRTLESLPRTCFCPSCLESFRKASGIAWPDTLSGTPAVARWIFDHHPAEWTDWKCRVIADWARDLAAAARQVKPGIKINVHLVPWRADDFGGAARAVAGQDPALLEASADVLSPMAYHHMVGHTPVWIHSVVEDLSSRTGAAVLPSIQVDRAYTDRELSAEEFKSALDEALKPPSRGVVFWNWDALAASPEKRKCVRQIAGTGGETGPN